MSSATPSTPSPDTSPDAPIRFASRTARVGSFRAMDIGKRAAALEASGVDVVRMNLGEPDHGVPPRVVEAMRQAVTGRSPYMPALGLPELREAIARWHGTALGAEVSADRVVVTSGASAALLLVAAALVEPADEILVADPSYPCNRRFVEGFGGTARLVPTGPATRFQLTRALVESHWNDAVRGVMIASPSNPTGTSVPHAELVSICAAVAARGGHRIVDEIYLPLAFDAPARSILADDPGALSIGSFSKFFAMPGWRLGWAIVPDAMVDTIERLAQNFYICAPAPAQRAALECFHPDTLALCESRRAELVLRRDRTLAGLRDGGWHVPVRPDGAFYAWIDVRDTGLDSAELVHRVLDEAHVALAPGADFGDADAGAWARLSYATSMDDIDRALDRLARWRSALAPVG